MRFLNDTDTKSQANLVWVTLLTVALFVLTVFTPLSHATGM
ncbi:hypothetical protein [Pseudoalteromonas xiamenensis]|nr:hypothetical protein [Pseudoalteromonas xiamenensis]